MTDYSKLEIGKTYYPKKQKIEISESCVRGPGWKAELVSGRYEFEFLASRHGGGVDCYELTKEEFDKIKDGLLTFDNLLDLTDRNPRRNPIANG